MYQLNIELSFELAHIISYVLCCVSYLVAAVALQSFWSLSLAMVDIYALLVRRSLRNSRVVSMFAVGDGVRDLFLIVVHH